MAEFVAVPQVFGAMKDLSLAAHGGPHLAAGAAQPSKYIRNLHMEQQGKTNWCWAAVAIAIERAYEPKSKRDQPTLVRQYFHENKIECAADLSDCNKIAPLKYVLDITKNMRDFPTATIRREDLLREIDANCPVALGIYWEGMAAGHYIVVAGRTPEGRFCVADPATDSGSCTTTYGFEELMNNYRMDGGTCKYVYCTQPATGQLIA